MKKWSIIILVFLICCFICPATAKADAGPKPFINVIAKNMPDDTLCYMDLLVEGEQSGTVRGRYRDSKYDKELVDKLKNYNIDGWHSVLVGYRYPVTVGDITCEVKNGKCFLDYGYMIPDRFKIIVVTENGDTVVSNIIDRKAFCSIVFFDFKNTKASEGPLSLAYLLQFLLTCSATLMIEGLVFWMFRFNIKENIKLFLRVNISTQIFLYICISLGMYCGVIGALLMYFIAEIIIFKYEANMFSDYLEQHSKARRVLFSLAANIASLVAGIFLNYKL